MANPLEQSVRSALRANDAVGALFARVGTSDHPRGYLPTAYRNANRAMRSALREENAALAVADVFNGLRRQVEMETRSLFSDAQATGREEATRQLRYYGIQTLDPAASPFPSDLEQAALDAVMSRLEAQEATVRAQVMLGVEIEQIIGSADRTGTLRQSDLAATVAAWAASLVWAGFGDWATDYMRTPGAYQFDKQVVAALDNRTTDCCLKAHGQVQKLAGKFELNGSPRFADRMDWTPFHWWCRSAIALHLPGFDDGLTARMVASAQTILVERARGIFIDRDPANAF